MAGRRGKVPDRALPPPSRSRYDWAFIAARLQAEPGTWVMVPDVSNGLYTKITKGQNRWLTALGGHLRVHQRNTRLVAGERGTSRRGELWLCWTPNEGG